MTGPPSPAAVDSLVRAVRRAWPEEPTTAELARRLGIPPWSVRARAWLAQGAGRLEGDDSGWRLPLLRPLPEPEPEPEPQPAPPEEATVPAEAEEQEEEAPRRREPPAWRSAAIDALVAAWARERLRPDPAAVVHARVLLADLHAWMPIDWRLGLNTLGARLRALGAQPRTVGRARARAYAGLALREPADQPPDSSLALIDELLALGGVPPAERPGRRVDAVRALIARAELRGAE